MKHTLSILLCCFGLHQQLFTATAQNLGLPENAKIKDVRYVQFDPKGQPVIGIKIGEKLQLKRWFDNKWKSLATAFSFNAQGVTGYSDFAEPQPEVETIAFDRQGLPVVATYIDTELGKSDMLVRRFNGLTWDLMPFPKDSWDGVRIYFDQKGIMYIVARKCSNGCNGDGNVPLELMSWNSSKKSWSSFGPKQLNSRNQPVKRNATVAFDIKGIPILTLMEFESTKIEATYITMLKWNVKTWIPIKNASLTIVDAGFKNDGVFSDNNQQPVLWTQPLQEYIGGKNGVIKVRRWTGAAWISNGIITEELGQKLQKLLFDNKNQVIAVLENNSRFIVVKYSKGTWQNLGGFSNTGLINPNSYFGYPTGQNYDFAMLGNEIRSLGMDSKNIVLQRVFLEPVSQNIPVISNGTTIVSDPFAPYQDSYKPTVNENKSLKDLILEQTKQYWKKKDTREFCTGKEFEIFDHVRGAFTRENANQDAYLYIYCSNGEPWWNYSGIAVVENQKLMVNWVFQGSSLKLELLPDINRNGRNEISLIAGMVHMGHVNSEFSVLEFSDRGIQDIVSAESYSSNCGTINETLKAQAHRYTVKSGTSPIFYKEVFKKLQPCKEQSSWQRISGPTAFVAPSNLVNQEGIVFLAPSQNPNSWLRDTWYSLKQPVSFEVNFVNNQISVRSQGKTYPATLNNETLTFRRDNQEIILTVDTRQERLYLGTEKLTNNRQVAVEAHEPRTRMYMLQVFQRAYARLANNETLPSSANCGSFLFDISAPTSVLACAFSYDNQYKRVRLEVFGYLMPERVVFDSVNFPFRNSGFDISQLRGTWGIEFKNGISGANLVQADRSYQLLMYGSGQDSDIGRLTYSSDNGDICTYQMQWIQRYGYAFEVKLVFIRANRTANNCQAPVKTANGRFWLFWNPETKHLSTQLLPANQNETLFLADNLAKSNVKFANQFLKLNPQDFASSDKISRFTRDSLQDALVTNPITPTNKIPIVLVHGWQVLNDALPWNRNSTQSTETVTPQIADWEKFLARVSEMPELSKVFDFYTFGYDSSQRVETSGLQLSEQVALYFQQPVALIGFSMGGLVSDVAKQNSPKSVGAVITMNTPYRGSRWVLCLEKSEVGCTRAEMQKETVDLMGRFIIGIATVGINQGLANKIQNDFGDWFANQLFPIEMADGTRDLAWQSGSRKFLKVPLANVESNPFLETLNNNRSQPRDYLAIGTAIGSLPSYGGHDGVVSLASQFAAENFDDVPVQVVTKVCDPNLYKTQVWTYCIDAQEKALHYGLEDAVFPWVEQPTSPFEMTARFLNTALPTWFQHAHFVDGAKNNPQAIIAALNFAYTKLYQTASQNVANPQNSSNQNQASTEITVYASEGWTGTGINVQKSMNIKITAQGKWGNGQYYNNVGEIYTPMYGPEGANPVESRFDYPLSDSDAKVGALISFAKALERERKPLEAMITTSYSNGRAEGHVNRLKFIKRQGYGRAGFELLRKRVLLS